MINIQKILEMEPTLTAFGIEGPRTFHTDEQLSVDQIKMVATWLSEQELTKRFNPYITSYGYKHIAERAMKTYISNGNFIAAVIHLGIHYKRIPNSPNILIGIKIK